MFRFFIYRRFADYENRLIYESFKQAENIRAFVVGFF